MAVTAFGVNDAQTVKLWSTLTMREALKATLFKKFLGKDKRSIIQRFTDLEKTAGDTIKYDLLMQMTSAGVTGDNRMRDNEDPLVYYQDSVVIDQLRNGHSFRGMSQQRTLHDLRTDGQMNISDWFAGKFDSYMFRYLCGDTTINHGQAGLAPDSTHYIMSGDVTRTGVIATDEGNLSNNDQFSLADVEYCVETAKNLAVPIRPAIIDGEEYYVMVLHDYSVTDMRLDVAASTYTSWPDIQLYANKRGLDNPLFTGALGVYNGVIFFSSSRIFSPRSNVRRNLFLGAQAGVFAVGNAYDQVDRKKFGGDNLMSWYEGEDDGGNEKYIHGGCKFGMKKTRFNSLDYGTLVVSSYAVSHAT